MTSKEALERLIEEIPFIEDCIKLIKQDLERLEKYKKAIEVINDVLELYIDFYEVGVENRSSFIEYEDSELLKEVLKEVE